MDGAELWLTKRQEGGNFEIGRIEVRPIDWRVFPQEISTEDRL
jgi:hypothetical protein